ncbi:tail fiber domain-containing protein [Rhodococcus kronopolitis]|uniref:Tail fiber domain-containing protein n=1 Tax=Rhodococcus kronopolitis TaxID=1460226 RepID=A0ABV9FP27_9NOCA
MTEAANAPARGDAADRESGAAPHPLAWLRSHLTHRRGVRGARPVPVGANEVLDRLAELPVSVWTYRFDHDSVRHLGPMAQDFASTFGLGSSERAIAVVDANGVCMASIQALHRRLVAAEAELAELRAALSESVESVDREA